MNRSFRWSFLFLLLWATLYLYGLNKPFLHGGEPRRVLIAMEMDETGSYMRQTLFGRPYIMKPPGFPLSITAAHRVFSSWDPWVVRLPSAVGIAIMAASMFWLFNSWGPWTRVAVTLGALVAPLAWEKGHQAEIDALMMAFVALAGVAGIKASARGHKTSTWWVGYLALGISFMIKGPVSLPFVLPAWIAAAWASRGSGVRPSRHLLNHLGGIAVCLAISAPWYIDAFRWAGETAGTTLAGEIIGRSSDRITFPFLQPLLIYTMTALGGALPWTLVPLLGWKFKDGDHARTHRTFSVAAWAWLIGGLLIVSSVPDVHPRYIFPVTPAILVLAGITIEKGCAQSPAWRRRVPRFLPAMVVLSLVLRIVEVHAILPAFERRHPIERDARALVEHLDRDTPILIRDERKKTVLLFNLKRMGFRISLYDPASPPTGGRELYLVRTAKEKAPPFWNTEVLRGEVDGREYLLLRHQPEK